MKTKEKRLHVGGIKQRKNIDFKCFLPSNISILQNGSQLFLCVVQGFR
jgi:hypothetical protein